MQKETNGKTVLTPFLILHSPFTRCQCQRKWRRGYCDENVVKTVLSAACRVAGLRAVILYCGLVYLRVEKKMPEVHYKPQYNGE